MTPSEPRAPTEQAEPIGAGWTILAARFADEDSAQAAVLDLGDDFVSSAIRARGGLSRGIHEDAALVVVDDGGRLRVRDARELETGALRGLLRGIAFRLPFGLFVGGTLKAVLGARSYLVSRRREAGTSSERPLAGVLSRLEPDEAALLARVSDQELAGALAGLDDGPSLEVTHAPEPRVRSALQEDRDS